MSEGKEYQADFAYPGKKKIEKEQIVGVFDLVGFTKIKNNKGLVRAVETLETEIDFALGPYFHWGEMGKREVEGERNDILLLSTGDGYVVAFSQGMDDLIALGHLVNLYKQFRKQKLVITLGINKGKNYVVGNTNERVNIVGWGINLAVRAQQFAEKNQIICTEHFANSILKNSEEISDSVMFDIGVHTIKSSNIQLFNYYKRGEFGSDLTDNQRKLMDQNKVVSIVRKTKKK